MGQLTYIAVDESNKDLSPKDAKTLRELILQVDGVSEFALKSINDSADLATELEHPDMNMKDPKNWDRLIIIMIPGQGAIRGYKPRRLVEAFIRNSAKGKSSYEVFRELLLEDN